MTTIRQMMTERGATKTGTVRVIRLRGALYLSPSRERAAVADAAAIALSDLDGRTVTVDGESATLRATPAGLRVEHPALPRGYELIETAWDMVADAEVA